MELIIIGIAALVAIVVLIFGISRLQASREADIEQVLGRYTDYDSMIEALEEEELEGRQEANQVIKSLNTAIQDREFAQRWKEQLARADLKITPAEYGFLHIVSVVVFFLVGTYLIFGTPILGIAAGMAGFFAPRIYVGYRKGKRLRTFENQLPDTLGMWVNGLRSGYSVLQAMEAIATEGPEPTATEFRRVVQEIQLGIPREEAFEHMLHRIPSEDLDLIITAVNIQQEVGGNLAEILDIISHTIRERIKLKGEIRVLTAQGRVTGYIIGGLPIALAILLYIISGDYMGRMIENRTCGWPMLGCGASLIGLGTAAIQKIVDIEI
ncbi:MAG: secretion system protein F [Phototrophicales bacterium]|nr:MAG: secretion system protein F [Phototrophicales bacterium]